MSEVMLTTRPVPRAIAVLIARFTWGLMLFLAKFALVGIVLMVAALWWLARLAAALIYIAYASWRVRALRVRTERARSAS